MIVAPAAELTIVVIWLMLLAVNVMVVLAPMVNKAKFVTATIEKSMLPPSTVSSLDPSPVMVVTVASCPTVNVAVELSWMTSMLSIVPAAKLLVPEATRVSMPRPPRMISPAPNAASPTMNVSFPAPPIKVSTPAPPVMVSLPEPAVTESLPKPVLMVLLPEPSMRMLSPCAPEVML